MVGSEITDTNDRKGRTFAERWDLCSEMTEHLQLV